jgi:hypothetical protein
MSLVYLLAQQKRQKENIVFINEEKEGLFTKSSNKLIVTFFPLLNLSNDISLNPDFFCCTINGLNGAQVLLDIYSHIGRLINSIVGDKFCMCEEML